MLQMLRFEWRQNRRGFMIGAAVVLLLQAMFAGVAKIYLGNPDITALMEMMPKGMMEAFGMHPESLSSFEGWMSSEPYTFFVLLLGFFAMNWAIGSIVKERDRQTAEFLFTLPRGRSHIYWAKWGSHLLQVVIIVFLAVGVTLLFGTVTGSLESAGAIVNIVLAAFFVTLGFMGIGYAITPWLESERGALSLGVGIVLLMFLFNMLSGFDEKLNWMAEVSLFHLFDTFAISAGDGIGIRGILTSMILFAAGSAAGWVALLKRDL